LSDLDILRKVGWLSTTPKGFQNAVLKRGDLRKATSGEPLFLTGDPAGGIFGVVEGQIELHLPGDRDAPALAHIAGPGHWYGDLAAILGHPRRFTFLARGACRILRLRRAEMIALCTKEPVYWRCFAELVATNLRLTVSFIDAIRRRSPTGRIAAELLILAGEQLDAVVIHASQAELAAITGLSRAAVNTALGELQKRGWVRNRYAAVEIIDRNAIELFTLEGAE
jgi:CRP/FNR family transcriptional regulator, cyclic AMP receptor protein